MNGHEQVGVVLARNLGTFAQRNEVVPGAHQHRLESRFGIDQGFGFTGDRQHHVLFPRLVVTDGARIFATMAGIKGNDDIALTGLAHRAGRGLRQRRSARLRSGRQV